MTDSELRLQQLMVGYQSGSAAAFDELYGLLAPGLNGYLLKQCRDRTLAEELLQETFLQLHRSRQTYRADAPVKPWAFAIARHVVHMHWRAARVRPQLSGAEPLDALERPAGFDDAVLQRQQISAAMAAMPRQGRRLLLLHHVFGFNFDEIAARLKIGAGAAKVRASRGRAALRALLREKE